LNHEETKDTKRRCFVVAAAQEKKLIVVVAFSLIFTAAADTFLFGRTPREK
jgi:hypothetical protein